MSKLNEDTRRAIKIEMNSIANEMLLEKDPENLKILKQRYEALSDLLKPDWKISPDTIALVSANLLGILLILNHERLDIISTRALGFISKIRV